MRVQSYNIFINYLIVILVIKSCKSNESYTENIPGFLREFVEHLDSPVELILFLCYKADILVKIAKGIHNPIRYHRFGQLKSQQYDNKNRIIFVTDTNCPGALEFLEESVYYSFYRHPFRWIIFNGQQSYTPNISSLIDSNIYLVTINNNGSLFFLQQVYKFGDRTSYIFEPYGNWTISTGLQLFQKVLILSRRRSNLNRTPVTSSLLLENNDSVDHLDDYRDKHIDTATKLNFAIIKILVDTLNGTMKRRFIFSWEHLNITKDEWNGMIHDIIKNEADIGGSPVFITMERLKVVDFISETSPQLVNFILREPPLSFVANIYSLPFTNLVWICSILLVGISIAFLILSLKFQSKFGEDNRKEGSVYEFSDFVIFAISAVCQMGILLDAKITSARISMIFLLGLLLFLYTSYTANIVAFLQSTSPRINTLSDVLHSNLKVGVEDTHYNHYFFESTTEPVRKAIYETKVLVSNGKPNFVNVSEGISRLRKGSYVFHAIISDAYQKIESTFLEHEKCNLQTIQFIETTLWCAIRKASPYKEIFKVNLFRIREYGLQKRENEKILPRKPMCSKNVNYFKKVTLVDCCPPFQILLIGYVLAVFIFMVEKLIKICKIL